MSNWISNDPDTLRLAAKKMKTVPLQSANARIKYRAAIDVVGGEHYFKASLVAPFVTDDGGKLVITAGWGKRRYWGTPYCHSSLSWMREDVARIDLWLACKHTFNRPSYYFHFQLGTETWQRLTGRSTLIKALLAGIAVRPKGLDTEETHEPLTHELELE